MRSQLARFTGCALMGLLAAVVLPAATAAQSLTQLFLGVDRSHVLTITDPARKIAVANPAIADVQVISPTQLLVIGKAPGVTSLVIFSAKAPRHYDLVVHPSPLGNVAPASGMEPPHSVLVQRGPALTEQLFTRDKDQHWQELGQIKPDIAEPGKK